jgi:hypothetical protein
MLSQNIRRVSLVIACLVHCHSSARPYSLAECFWPLKSDPPPERSSPFEEISWRRFEKLRKTAPGPGDGGNSETYEAWLGSRRVHIKLYHRQFSQSPQGLAFIDRAALIQNEFAAEKRAAPVIGTTNRNGQKGVVSDFVPEGVFVKAYYEETTRRVIRHAVLQCEKCRWDWQEGLVRLKEMFYLRAVSVPDPQFIFLPDGRIWLYDFDNYQKVDRSSRWLRESQVAIQKVIDELARP